MTNYEYARNCFYETRDVFVEARDAFHATPRYRFIRRWWLSREMERLSYDMERFSKAMLEASGA